MAWHAPHEGRTGRPPVFSNAAIQFCLSIKVLFKAAAQADRRDGRKPAAARGAGLARSGLLDAMPPTEGPEGADPLSPCRRAAETAGG